MNSYFVSAGAGRFQGPLIKAAHRAGLAVIGVDRDPAAMYADECDIFINCSLLDIECILARLEDNVRANIKAVYARSFGLAHQTVDRLSTALGLTCTPYSLHCRFQDKEQFRQLVSSAGLDRQFFQLPSSDPEKQPSFPMVVKPVSGASKEGVTLIKDIHQLKQLKAEQPELFNNAVFEPYVDGLEITVLGLVENGRLEVWLLTDKYTLYPSPFIEIAHLYPSSLTDPQPGAELRQALQASGTVAVKGAGFTAPTAEESAPLLQGFYRGLQQLVSKAGVENSPFLCEAVFSGGRFYLVEAALEVGGEFLADYMLGPVYFDRLVGLLCSSQAEPNTAHDRLQLPVHQSLFVGFQCSRAAADVTQDASPDVAVGRVPFSLDLRATGTNKPAGNNDRRSAFGITVERRAGALTARLNELNWEYTAGP